MSELFDYGVFLSYSSKDKKTAQALGKRLRKDGLRVRMDGRKIQAFFRCSSRTANHPTSSSNSHTLIGGKATMRTQQ